MLWNKVNQMCEVFEVSQSGYYSWKANKLSLRKRRDIELSSMIKQIHQSVKGRYGSPRICSCLKDQGKQVSRKRVNRLMQENNIYSKVKGKYKVTTNSKHNHLIAPNLLEQKFIADRPNQIWVSDISYIGKPGMSVW